MIDSPERRCDAPASDSDIEIIRPDIPRGRIRFAVFDFDGTLSLIREGWQDVMIPMMADLLEQAPKAEERKALDSAVREFVMRLTGKQTIYQMIELCAQLKARGARPNDPPYYKKMYLELLNQRIGQRLEGLRNGGADPEALRVPGAFEILQELRARGVRLYLASGTDLRFVLEEAGLLGLSAFFEGRIYGALDNYKDFSKEMLIRKIIRDHQIPGPALAVFGDGYVEIENAKASGGIAVGLATDEARREGIDAWKRERLIAAGADLILADFRPWKALARYLFNDEI